MAPTNPDLPYLGKNNIDDLGRMVVALLSEVWILRDRVHVLEDLLAQRGGPTFEEIDNHKPKGESLNRLEAERKRLISNVIAAPLLAREREVEDILSHSGLEA